LEAAIGEIEISEGVRIGGAGLDAVLLQQELVADQVRNLAIRGADTEVDVGFTEPDRQQLGVTVGEMQERDVAARRHVVEVGGQIAGQHGLAIEHQAGSGGSGEDLHKFTTVHVHRNLLGGIRVNTKFNFERAGEDRK
jgi:hypothetical protein